MQTLHSQRGLSPITWIIVIAVIIFLAKLAMEAVPMAKTYYTFDAIVTEKVANDASQKDADPSTIERNLQRNLDFQDVDFSINKESMTYKQRRDGGYELTIHYKWERPWLWKYSLVLTYDRVVQVGMEQAE